MSGPGFKALRSFGGILSPVSGKEWQSNPKTARPVAVKQAMHLVLRSSLARNEFSLLLHDRAIHRILQRLAKRFGIRLYDVANAGNHLHLIVRLPHRDALTPFLKAASGLIARLVLGVERGHKWSERPGPRIGVEWPTRFWDARPWSRIVSFGPDFKQLKDYLMLNRPWPACAANRADLAGFARGSYRAMLKEVRRLQASGALERLPSFGFGQAKGWGSS
jgi:REP element-mobilizing transposase RayT